MDTRLTTTAPGGPRHPRDGEDYLMIVGFGQEKYLEAMHSLEFTDEQIEENRRHHGGSLYLSDDVAINFLVNGAVDLGVGVSVCHKTGELVLNQVAQDLEALGRALGDLIDQAYAKFNDPLGNSEHADAMMQFRGTLMGGAEQFWYDLESPHDRDKAA